jgi:hypothetical protein
VFTRSPQCSLSRDRRIQSIPPHLTYLRRILISSSYLRVSLHNGLFPAGFPTKTLQPLLFSPTRATFTAHLILLDIIILTLSDEEYSYEAPRYAYFSSILLFRLSSVLNLENKVCKTIRTTGTSYLNVGV